MATPAEPVIRRWNGKLREATIWKHHTPDPELSAPDGNCFIYTSASQVQREQPSFTIPFERLVWSQCQPLIKKAITHEPHSGHSPAGPEPPRSTKSHPSPPICVLLLQAPKECGSDEVVQYDITTRNFFAWLMGKPIVGPHPTSALLALKIRMDVWRTSFTDNFATLDQYAKTQGYGDLGDVQTFLRNHLEGLTAAPTGYKLLASEEHTRAMTLGSRSSSFKDSILESAWWTQLRRSRPNSNPDPTLSPRNGSLSDSSEDGADADSQEMVMSGAIPPAKDIDDYSTTPYLPTSAEEQSVSTLPRAGESREIAQIYPSLKQLESPGEELSRPRYQSRTWSLPNLHEAVGDEVPRPLYRQSSWLSNVCQEHIQLSATRRNSVLTQRAAAPAISNNALRSSRRQSLSVPRHGRSISHARQPSPILEEDWMSAIRRRPSASPASSLHEVNNETSVVDHPSGIAEVDGTGIAMDMTPVMPGSASSISARAAPKSSSTTTTGQCPHGVVLPSHSILVCKTCQKPKPPRRYGNQLRQQLTSGRGSSTKSLSMPASRTSINLHDTASPAAVYPLDLYLSDNLAGSDTAISRFPSLRGRDQSTETLDTQLLQAPTRGSEDHGESRHDSIASDMSVQHSPRVEKPSGIFGGRSFVEAPNTASSTRKQDGGNGQPPKTATLAEAHGAPTDVRMPASSRISTLSAQPQHSLRISCDLTEIEPCEPPLARPWSELKDRPKTWPEKTASVRAHRLPINEQSPGAGSTKTMDTMLQEVIAWEGDIPVPQSPQYIIAPGGPQIMIERRSGQISQTPRQGPQQTKKLTKKRTKGSSQLSNSLKMWSSKRLQKEAPSTVEYQGLVLCMDRHGYFSTLPSPAESFLDLSDMRDLSYNNNRSRTPLCELS